MPVFRLKAASSCCEEGLVSLELYNANGQKTFNFSALLFVFHSTLLPLAIHGVAPSTTAAHSLRFSQSE